MRMPNDYYRTLLSRAHIPARSGEHPFGVNNRFFQGQDTVSSPGNS